MERNKRDQQPDQQNRRQMPHAQPRDLGNQRNEEETGKPIQLDKDGKGHQGSQPRNPQTEQPKPDQGQD